MTTETIPTHIIGSIFDVKAGIFSNPHLYRSKADFVRTVQSEAKRPESMLHKFPSDYELHVTGEWSEYAGIVEIADDKIGSVLDLCPLN